MLRQDVWSEELARRLAANRNDTEVDVECRRPAVLDTLIDEIARYDAFEEILLLASHQAENQTISGAS